MHSYAYVYDEISLILRITGKKKVPEKIKTQILCSAKSFLRKSCRLCVYRPQMATKYGVFALHSGQLMLQSHTQNMKYLGFFTATMVTRTRLNVTFIRT